MKCTMLGAGLYYRITIKRLHGVLKVHPTFKFQITLPISSCYVIVVLGDFYRAANIQIGATGLHSFAADHFSSGISQTVSISNYQLYFLTEIYNGSELGPT